MSLDPSLTYVLGLTCLVALLFLAGLGLIVYTLITRRRAASVPGIAGARPPARPSYSLVVIGVVLLLASLAACAYDTFVLLALAGR